MFGVRVRVEDLSRASGLNLFYTEVGHSKHSRSRPAIARKAIVSIAIVSIAIVKYSSSGLNLFYLLLLLLLPRPQAINGARLIGSGLGPFEPRGVGLVLEHV